MTDTLASLNDKIALDQVGVVTILETVIDELEKTTTATIRTDLGQEFSRVLGLAHECARALREAKGRFESMRDALYNLEGAIKIFDGDGYRRAYQLPAGLRRVLVSMCSAAELEELRARFGATFDFRDPVVQPVVFRDFNPSPNKDGGQ